MAKKVKSTKPVKKAVKPAKPASKAKKALQSQATEPEVLEPEVIEPEIIEPEIVESEVIDDADIVSDSEVADLDVTDGLIKVGSKAIKTDDPGLVPADPIARYMAEIRKYPLLTKEEEHELAVRYREHGDREAAQKLVTSNLRFVVKVAAEYSKFGSRLIDLVQEGNVGLMQAVKEFNPYKGVRLITYAVWWIRGQIQEHLMRQYSMVRIGTTATQRKLFYELQRKRDQLERMGFEAGIAQLSGRLGIPEQEVKEMGERVLKRDISFNLPAYDSDKETLIDLQSNATDIGADEQLGHAEELDILRENLDKVRPSLNPRELFVLENRLLADEPMTLQEIGDKYKMTREAARQLEGRLMDKIKKQMSVGTKN